MSEILRPIEAEVRKTDGKFREWNDRIGSSIDESIQLIEQVKKYASTKSTGGKKERDTAKSLFLYIYISSAFLTAPSNSTNGSSDEQTMSGADCATLWNSVRTASDNISKIGTTHREMHPTVSRIGKTIDRQLISDFSLFGGDDDGGASTPPTFNGVKAICESASERALVESVVEHFYRRGLRDVGDQLRADAGVHVNAKLRERFNEINAILLTMRNGDITEALDWAQRHHDELRKIESKLEFKLHRYRFVQLLEEGGEKRSEVLAYAKVFSRFDDPSHLREVQKLMGSLIFLPRRLKPATCSSGGAKHNNMAQSLLDELCQTFTRDACELHGIAHADPIDIAIKIGCMAIAPLLQIRNAISTRHPTSSIWESTREELPVEIPVGRQHQYHPVFACPILRQPSNESNPPMRLACGHAISKDALDKLSAVSVTQFKCPYCPKQQDPRNAREIYF